MGSLAPITSRFSIRGSVQLSTTRKERHQEIKEILAVEGSVVVPVGGTGGRAGRLRGDGEVIDRGHLFIAQPPLYKVTRGKSEQYLKHERALEDFLIDSGLENSVLRLQSGEKPVLSSCSTFGSLRLS